MILPAPNPFISDGDRFRAMFTEPGSAAERCEQVAKDLGIDLAAVPPDQVLDCIRVLCDVLVEEGLVVS